MWPTLPAQRLWDGRRPATQAEWVALGRRVFCVFDPVLASNGDVVVVSYGHTSGAIDAVRLDPTTGEELLRLDLCCAARLAGADAEGVVSIGPIGSSSRRPPDLTTRGAAERRPIRVHAPYPLEATDAFTANNTLRLRPAFSSGRRRRRTVDRPYAGPQGTSEGWAAGP